MIDPSGIPIQAFIILTGIVGQIYIALQKVKGFYFWIASNVALIYVSFVQHSWGQFGLYWFFLIMCFVSIHKWKRNNLLVANGPGVSCSKEGSCQR